MEPCHRPLGPLPHDAGGDVIWICVACLAPGHVGSREIAATGRVAHGHYSSPSPDFPQAAQPPLRGLVARRVPPSAPQLLRPAVATPPWTTYGPVLAKPQISSEAALAPARPDHRLHVLLPCSRCTLTPPSPSPSAACCPALTANNRQRFPITSISIVSFHCRYIYIYMYIFRFIVTMCILEASRSRSLRSPSRSRPRSILSQKPFGSKTENCKSFQTNKRNPRILPVPVLVSKTFYFRSCGRPTYKPKGRTAVQLCVLPFLISHARMSDIATIRQRKACTQSL